MPLAALDGVDIYYRELGDGRPCLALHGGLGVDHATLLPWLAPLGDALRLVFYDHRCNGRSGRPPLDTLTLPQLCDDAEALRCRLGLGPAVLLGHSCGGFIALECALRRPQAVSHLILVNSAARFDPASPELARRLAERGLGAALERFFAAPADDHDSFRRYLFEARALYFPGLGQAAVEAALGRIVCDKPAYLRSMEIFAGWDVSRRLGEIRAPTLVLCGGDDVITPVEEAERLARGIPGAELVVLAGCGHNSFVDRQEAFLGAVRDWLRRRG